MPKKTSPPKQDDKKLTHPFSRKPSNSELQEILEHFSREPIWSAAKIVHQESIPKFRRKGRRVNFAIDDDGNLVCRFSTPLRKVPSEMSTGVKPKKPLPKKGEPNSEWWESMTEKERWQVFNTITKAKLSMFWEEERAYIEWNAIVASLTATFFVFRSWVYFIQGSVHHSDYEKAGLETFLNTIAPFFEEVGIDVWKAVKILSYSKDTLSKPLKGYEDFPIEVRPYEHSNTWLIGGMPLRVFDFPMPSGKRKRAQEQSAPKKLANATPKKNPQKPKDKHKSTISSRRKPKKGT